MFAELLAVSMLRIGPFWQQGPAEYRAARPFYSREEETTDVLWPLFTAHRDWWRCCWFISHQDFDAGDSQFQVLPFWFSGTERGEDYWGLFPFWGHHPNFLLMYDWDFALWPLWMRYRTPRGDGWVEKNCVCWPFVSWRSDGSWGVWPLYGRARRRESFHQYALWPLVTWAQYEADRDTGGAGYSWMVWPLWAEVRREREHQTMFLPPLFSYTETCSRVSVDRGDSAPGVRLRCPWPLVEIERFPDYDRTSVFPFWEHRVDKAFADGRPVSEVTRFGWRLVELYDDETRVFPFWVSRRDGSYFRLWPFYEEMNADRTGELKRRRALALFPIRWADGVERNWAPFWTFYEALESPVYTDHSLFWGIVRWRTYKD